MRDRFSRRPGGRKGCDGGLEGRDGRIGIFRGISLEVVGCLLEIFWWWEISTLTDPDHEIPNRIKIDYYSDTLNSIENYGIDKGLNMWIDYFIAPQGLRILVYYWNKGINISRKLILTTLFWCQSWINCRVPAYMHDMKWRNFLSRHPS